MLPLQSARTHTRPYLTVVFLKIGFSEVTVSIFQSKLCLLAEPLSEYGENGQVLHVASTRITSKRPADRFQKILKIKTHCCTAKSALVSRRDVRYVRIRMWLFPVNH